MNAQTGGQRILMHGLLLILAGLIWGLAVSATPFPRLALGAHIQFVTNGLLFVVLAIVLLTVSNNCGPKSIRVMVAAAWLTWAMALSEVGNSWWGTNQMLSISAAQAGAVGGEPWQEAVVEVTHAVAGLGLIVAWGLLVLGCRKQASSPGSP